MTDGHKTVSDDLMLFVSKQRDAWVDIVCRTCVR